MSTRVEQVPQGWVVTTILKEGRQKKMPRRPVFVDDPSLDAMKAEVKRQAQQARVQLDVVQPSEELVD